MADEVGDIERREPPDVGLVQTQEPAARGKIVVDDVEDFALHASPESREGDRLRTVVDVRERDGVAATHVQEDSERPDPHAARDVGLAGTVHRPRPDDDMRDPEFPAILGDDLLLLDLGEAVGLAPQLGTALDRTPFVQQPSPRLARVRIHGERADVDEAPQAAMPQARLQEIAGRDDRVHERIGKGLLAGAGRQVEDHGGILRGRGTILARQEIAPDPLDARSPVDARHGVEPGELARGPGETAQVAESTLEQGADEPRPDEPRGARDEDAIVGPDDDVVVVVWEHAAAIQGCGHGAHAVLPASTVRTVPVMLLALGPRRNSTASATSSTSANRRSALRRATCSRRSPSRPRVMSVSRKPGATAFTLTPRRPTSRASDRVNPIIAAFVAAYTDRPLYPVKPMIDETLTMRPPPSAIMWRTTYLVRTMGESVFTRMRRSICELCMIARAPSAAAAALLTSP